MGNQLKKLTTLTTNNNMFKNFASALALLAIGANASIHEKPNAAGELSSKEAYKYGRFVASMKASKAMGSASAFALYDLESFSNDQNVFDNWNAFATVPSLVHNEEESVKNGKLTRILLWMTIITSSRSNGLLITSSIKSMTLKSDAKKESKPLIRVLISSCPSVLSMVKIRVQEGMIQKRITTILITSRSTITTQEKILSG